MVKLANFITLLKPLGTKTPPFPMASSLLDTVTASFLSKKMEVDVLVTSTTTEYHRFGWKATGLLVFLLKLNMLLTALP